MEKPFETRRTNLNLYVSSVPGILHLIDFNVTREREIDFCQFPGLFCLIKKYPESQLRMQATMEVREIMARAVQAVQPEDGVAAAARRMKDFDIGCLPVQSGGHVIGIVTDRDIVIRGLAIGEDLSDVRVSEVMTPDPSFCTEDDTLMQAIHIMEANLVRRLPVLNAERTLVGIVSLGDLCTHTAANLAGELICRISSPAHHELSEA